MCGDYFKAGCSEEEGLMKHQLRPYEKTCNGRPTLR